MHKGYKLIPVDPGQSARLGVDREINEFVESMGYGLHPYSSPEAYLQRFETGWVKELHEALKQVLSKDRRVLSIGSGECEHDIPLFMEGYPITGSDIAEEALKPVRVLFPQFRAIVFDVFNPALDEQYDDVLITGLDFYFNEEKVKALMQNVKSLLRSRGRLLFVLRYRDNWLTRIIDYVGIPLIGFIRNAVEFMRRSPRRYKLKFHGYRRTQREIIKLAEHAGFRLRRILHAGYSMELTRLHIDHFPHLFNFTKQIDSKLHVLNNAVLFEFEANS